VGPWSTKEDIYLNYGLRFRVDSFYRRFVIY